ncbi:TPA: DUF6572 domain-containing protein [Streptococcus suis]|uniref:DUF6572 domain-containing protein n=1 Tax=Streptococcus suis TaxID=1307 RepID=UPI000CF61D00|nr:DUF6572 domain-containing protein [Streptococcus suis]
MSEDYLPIKESLGYQNVKKALWNVFAADLDDISIDEKPFESFSFLFHYKDYEMTMLISDTEKHVQFQAGEGGLFSISLPNPRYPTASFQKKVSLSYLISDKHISDKLRWCLGQDKEAVEYAMKVLKDYLDSDDAKILLESQEFYLDTATIDSIGVVDGHLELLLADGNAWLPDTEQDHLLKLQEKLNNYIHFIESKQYVESYGDDFTEKVINLTFQYVPSDNGLAFLVQVQKVLQPTDIRLKVVVPE